MVQAACTTLLTVEKKVRNMSEPFQLVYQSEIMADSRSSILKNVSEILCESRRHNVREGITGMLIYYEQCFFQILEGEKLAVESLYSRIKLDNRHNYVSLIWKGDATRRIFPDWRMGYSVPSELDVEFEEQLYSLRDLKQATGSILGGPTITEKLADWALSGVPLMH